MTAENKQSLQIQTLDSFPFTQVGGTSGTGRLTKGQNGAFDVQQIEGTVSVTSAVGATSYYQLARVPSNVIIKSVELLELGGGTVTTAPTFDVTVGISDALGTDGTQPSLQVIPSSLTTPPSNAYVANPGATTTGLSGTAALFAHSPTLTVGTWADVTFQAGNFVPLTNMQQPLWQAAGYSQDPGGMLDIVALGTNTSSFSAAMTLTGRVRFSMPSG